MRVWFRYYIYCMTICWYLGVFINISCTMRQNSAFSQQSTLRDFYKFFAGIEKIYTKVTSKKYIYDIHCIDFDFCYDVHRGYGKDLIEI